jgi:LmbE family N-acetylglucosaminyl deacetylase
MKRKFLVISPHPDDADFGASGCVAKLVKEGNTVEYMIVSDGSKGSHVIGLSGKKLALIREKEQKASAKILGVSKVTFLRQIDGEIENTPQLRKRLVKEMRRIKPDCVMSFDPSSLKFESVYRSHRDHRLVAEAVFDAIYPAVGNVSFFPELVKQGFGPHQIKELWFFASPRPNRRIDITKTMDIKLAALGCHKSQMGDMSDFEKFIRTRARTEAKKAGRYAEGFRVINFDHK